MPGKSLKKPLLLERFGFFFVEIGNNAIDVQVDDGLATLGREEGSAVFLVVHEEILGQDCWAERVLKDIERGLEVRITVGIVQAELVAREVFVFISSAPSNSATKLDPFTCPSSRARPVPFRAP